MLKKIAHAAFIIPFPPPPALAVLPWGKKAPSGPPVIKYLLLLLVR